MFNKDGLTYHCSADNKPVKGRAVVDGVLRFFDEDGVMVTCQWQEIDGNWFYFGADGIAAKGKTLIGDKEFYFAENCAMCTGVTETEEGEKFYHETNGYLLRGFMTDSLGNGYQSNSLGVITSHLGPMMGLSPEE